LDVGLFAIVYAVRYSNPFYYVQGANGTGAVGTLELFAALGALGWLARNSLDMLRRDRAGGTGRYER
jgi:hypothetical protein